MFFASITCGFATTPPDPYPLRCVRCLMKQEMIFGLRLLVDCLNTVSPVTRQGHPEYPPWVHETSPTQHNRAEFRVCMQYEVDTSSRK